MMRSLPVHIVLLCLLGASAQAQSPYPIAGVTPDARPQGAPTITEVVRDKAWRQRYLSGVVEPYTNIPGLTDQGAWYTPFNRPGMPPPYDLRGWHASKGKRS